MKKLLLLAILFTSTSVFANSNLQISTHSIQPRIVPMNATGIPMMQIDLTAGDETIFVDKLIFNRTGLSSSSDIKSIRATGENINTRSFPMMYNDIATVSFFGKLIIPANTTQSITINANLDVQGVGRTIGLTLVDIVSSASKTNFNDPEIETITPPATLTKSSSIENKIVEIESLNFEPSRLRLESWQKLARFRLRNLDKKSATLDSLYLDHQGTGSLPNIFYNLVLTSQQSVISNMATLSDRAALFTFLDNTTVDANSDRLLEVWGKVKRNKSTYSVDFYAENDDVIIK